MAVVHDAVDPEYKRLIHTNATALLRPKTGLKDMFVELARSASRRRWPSRAARSRSPTRCPTSTPTRSSPRSTGTRATTSSCWSTAPAQGLQRQGRHRARAGVRALRADPPRPGPRRHGGRRPPRRSAPARQLAAACSTTALGHNAGQLVRLVDASSTVFRAFASEDVQHQHGRPRAAGRAGPDDRHTRQGHDVRRRARPDGHGAAARGRHGADGAAKPPSPLLRRADADRRRSRSGRSSSPPGRSSPTSRRRPRRWRRPRRT